jgi:hypothetical protein
MISFEELLAILEARFDAAKAWGHAHGDDVAFGARDRIQHMARAHRDRFNAEAEEFARRHPDMILTRDNAGIYDLQSRLADQQKEIERLKLELAQRG